jgi:predicted transcriptional regulator
MAAFQIPEHIDNQLNELAAATGQSKDDMILEALTDRFGLQQQDRTMQLSDFTPGQLERMQLSVDQIRRGEVVDSEEIEAFFDDWDKEIAGCIENALK